MAAATGFTTPIQDTVFHNAAHTASATDFAGIDALTVTANEVTHCREVGDISKSPNIFEFVEYGKDVQTKVSGPGSIDDFTFSFAADFSDLKHAALASASIGDLAEAVVKTVTGTDQETVDYVRGRIAGVARQRSSSDTTMITITIAPEQDSVIEHHA